LIWRGVWVRWWLIMWVEGWDGVGDVVRRELRGN